MANLLGQNIGTNYKGILNLGSTINTPVSGTLQAITDGDGLASALNVSTTSVAVSGTLGVTGTSTFNGGQNVLYASFDNDAALFQRVGAYGAVLRLGRSGVTQTATIDYPADGTVAISTVGVERIRVLAGGGLTFNGDTAAANALDDYEEGTWTPSQGSGLVVVGAFSSSGSYTKIGRMVVLRGVLTGATSVAANANQEIATNLPFTAATIFTGTIMNDASSLSGGIYVNSGAVIITTTIAATPSLYFSATYFV